MKTAIFSIALITFTLTAHAQWGSKNIKGNGKVTTVTRTLKDYDQVKIAGSFDVFLIAGAEGKITIEAEENLIPHIVTENNGDALVIKTEKGVNLKTSFNKGIVITVPFKDIEALSLAGSGDVSNKDLITAEHFEASLAGSGDIILELEAKNVKGSLAGSGDLTLKGKTETVELQVAGSGDIHAENFKATNADVNISGSGDIRMVCDGGQLNARISGSGDIRYSGTPSREDTKVSGSGSISN